MPVTPAQICNLGLLKAGEKQFIDALSDASELAQVSNLIYEPCRDEVLEAFWWPFATRRADLAVLADSEDDAYARSGWAYTYAVPADMLAPRYIETGIQNPAPDQQIPMLWEDDANQSRGVILTNQTSAELVYTRRTTETGKFSAKFVNALAWRLAYEFTFGIPVKPGVAERMLQGYMMALNDAAASSFKHSTPPPPPRPAAIRAR